MATPSVIEHYLTVLSTQLPAHIVEELADGLDQTCQRYLDEGLEPDAAADAALAEFGDPRVILADFVRQSPARRAARKLLVTGPVVGGCWGVALITGRAWTWPVPAVARLVLGVMLLMIIGTLAAAAFGRRYRSANLAAAAGCTGITAIDAALVITVPFVIPMMTAPLLLALAVSLARMTFAARSLRLGRAG